MDFIFSTREFWLEMNIPNVECVVLMCASSKAGKC